MRKLQKIMKEYDWMEFPTLGETYMLFDGTYDYDFARITLSNGTPDRIAIDDLKNVIKSLQNVVDEYERSAEND